MNINKFFSQNKTTVSILVAVIGFVAVNKLLNKNINQTKASAYARVYAASVATTNSDVTSLQNKIFQYIYTGALNPDSVLSNLDAIKKAVEDYTAKLHSLADAVAAGQIPASTIDQYLQQIATDIAQQLNIALQQTNFLNGSGNNGSFGGNNYPNYNDIYQQYLQYLQQYQQQYQQYLQQLSTQYGGQYGYPSYGYSYGYGYQQPFQQPIYPTQNFNYYPQGLQYGSPLQQPGIYYPSQYQSYGPYYQQQQQQQYY